MVKYNFDMKDGTHKEIKMNSGEVVEIASDDAYVVYDVIEAVKALWRGSANFLPECMENAEINVDGLGERRIEGRSRVIGDIAIKGSNVMFIECNINQVSIEIGVEDVEIRDDGKVIIKDKSENESSVVQALAFKKSLNKILSDYSIEGDISKDKAGKGSVKSNLHLVDKNGNRVSHDSLPDENYMIVTLALLMCQYTKYANIIFMDMGGVKEQENIIKTLQWINSNKELNRNNYIMIHNNFRNMRVAKRKIEI